MVDRQRELLHLFHPGRRKLVVEAPALSNRDPSIRRAIGETNRCCRDAELTGSQPGIIFGNLTLCKLPAATSGFNGQSIRAFSAVANTGLRGGVTGYATDDLNQLAIELNASFHDGAASLLLKRTSSTAPVRCDSVFAGVTGDGTVRADDDHILPTTPRNPSRG